MDFKIFLQKTLGPHNPEQIEELYLDNLINEELTEEHKKVLEEYINLNKLSLSDNSLKTLNNLPSLPSLKILELKKNKIDGNNLEIIFTLYPLLYKLKLSNNIIISLDIFKKTIGTKLRKIEIYGNTSASLFPAENDSGVILFSHILTNVYFKYRLPSDNSSACFTKLLSPDLSMFIIRLLLLKYTKTN